MDTLHTQGRILRAVTEDGSARLFVMDSTPIVQRAGAIHALSKTMTAALGRALTAASLMGTLLKEKDNSLTLQFRGDGPAGNIVCVSDYMGNVRGYAEHPEVELPPNAQGKLDVGGAVGKGFLYVVKDLGMREPYIGVSPLVSGEIAQDVTAYFAESEQTPTVCALGVRVNPENRCFAAGGYLLQLMPGAEEEIITSLETNVGKMDSVSHLLANGTTLEEIAAMVFEGIPYSEFDTFHAVYRCNCSREKYKRALIGLRAEDMAELDAANEPVETCCHFCGAKYTFSLEELHEARAQKEAEKQAAQETDANISGEAL